MSRRNRYPLGQLLDVDQRVERTFKDLASAWQSTREVWQDQKALKFEREKLEPISPVLARLTHELKEFTEWVDAADRELLDDRLIEE